MEGTETVGSVHQFGTFTSSQVYMYCTVHRISQKLDTPVPSRREFNNCPLNFPSSFFCLVNRPCIVCVERAVLELKQEQEKLYKTSGWLLSHPDMVGDSTHDRGVASSRGYGAGDRDPWSALCTCRAPSDEGSILFFGCTKVHLNHVRRALPFHGVVPCVARPTTARKSNERQGD